MHRKKISEMNELKEGEYHYFDGLTGIAKKNKFYVFFDYATGAREGLGDILGEGKTPELALIDALKKINKKMICMAKNFSKFINEKRHDPYEAWYGKVDNKIYFSKITKELLLNTDNEKNIAE